MSKTLLIVIPIIVLFLWSLFAEYDNKQWSNGEKQAHAIMLHQFYGLNVPELQNNNKCIKEGILTFYYHGNKAVFRCGSTIFPFYDEIIIDKSIVKKAYKDSLEGVKNGNFK